MRFVAQSGNLLWRRHFWQAASQAGSHPTPPPAPAIQLEPTANSIQISSLLLAYFVISNYWHLVQVRNIVMNIWSVLLLASGLA